MAKYKFDRFICVGDLFNLPIELLTILFIKLYHKEIEKIMKSNGNNKLDKVTLRSIYDLVKTLVVDVNTLKNDVKDLKVRVNNIEVRLDNIESRLDYNKLKPLPVKGNK